MFFMRASGQQEASAITNYVARELGGKKFALFYANNTWGKEALAGAEAVLKKLNITDYIALSSEEATINVTEQVKALKQFNPDSLGMFCIQEVAKELLNQLGTAWLIDKKLFGPQDLSAQSFINYVNRNKLKFFGTSVVPNPEGSLEIAKQYRDATSQLYIPVDNYGFETYIGADFFTHVLTHIDPPITSKKIINFITNIHDLPYKGLTFDFDPEKRQLLHSIWLISDNKDWKELKLKKPTKQISSKNGTRIEIPLGEKEAVLSIVTTLGLSGITKPEAESVRTGIKIIFDKYNKTTPKTALELIAVDYQDKAAVARSEIMRILQNNKTGLLLLPYSTLILESMLDLIEKQQILALFPMASGEIPDKALANICFLRASGKYEGYALTHYATSEHRDKKIAFVYSNNSFGKTVLKGAEKALKELNLKEYIAIPIEENYIGITEQQVKILKDFDPHCIGIFTIQATAKALLDKLGIEWVKQKILFGSQDLSPQTFRDYIALNKLNFVCSSVVPSPNSSLEIAQQFRRDTANIPISNDLICFEAYIAADFFTHILQQIKEPITSIKIIDYIEQINNYNYKGLTLNFDAKNRRLLNSIWIIDKENEWKEIKKSSLTKSTKSTKNNNAKKLNIGSILDLSRGDAVYGKTIKAVMEFLIDRANSKKAKNKPLIDLTVIDHEYMPEKARKAAETLLNTHHADIILCPVGSSPFASFLDYINKGDLISLFPVTVIPGKGSEIPNAIFLGVSYPEQAQVLVQYCMERLKMQRLAILYQNDEYGKTLLEGAKKALDKHNIKYTPISYERNSTNFSQQIEQIKTINPDTMGLFALSETSIEFLRQLGEPYTKRIRFFGANPISTQVMTDFLIKNEIQCIRTNIVPNYMDQNLQLSREFVQTMKEAHITPDTTAFETYICTEIFLDIVSNLKEPADKQSILQACKGIHNISFKGLMLNYDPEDNRLINDVWIDEGKQTPWIHIPSKKGK